MSSVVQTEQPPSWRENGAQFARLVQLYFSPSVKARKAEHLENAELTTARPVPLFGPRGGWFTRVKAQ